MNINHLAFLFGLGFYARRLFILSRLLIVVILLSGLSFATISSVTVKNDHSTCGSYRADVRTLTDSSADQIDFFAKRVEVTDLLAIPKPSNKNQTLRSGFEFNTYQVNCKISEYTIDSNGDIYLTAHQADDSTKTVTLVLTNPECSQAKLSSYHKFFVSIRNNFWLQTLPDCKLKKGMYKVVGVGYYDRHLDQVTLNPVTSFVKFW